MYFSRIEFFSWNPPCIILLAFKTFGGIRFFFLDYFFNLVAYMQFGAGTNLYPSGIRLRSADYFKFIMWQTLGSYGRNGKPDISHALRTCFWQAFLSYLLRFFFPRFNFHSYPHHVSLRKHWISGWCIRPNVSLPDYTLYLTFIGKQGHVDQGRAVRDTGFSKFQLRRHNSLKIRRLSPHRSPSMFRSYVSRCFWSY